MQIIRGVEFHDGSKEEKLPGFTQEFPLITSRAELDYFRGHTAPWHWHSTVELFFVESGEVRYETPNNTRTFPQGSGGMINSNVLHTTSFHPQKEKNIALLYLFDPLLLSGSRGSLIDRKYVAPLVSSPQVEIIALSPENPEQASILRLMQDSFRLPENEWGYELKLREYLSRIWLGLFHLAAPSGQEKHPSGTAADRIKTMLVYIHEHYSEKISVSELASAVFLSERECFRDFQRCLHMTPNEYIRSYRLQMACRMLEKQQDSVTDIGRACGLGSGSYFGKVFHAHMGCTPSEYRLRWQDRDRT